MDVWIFRLKFYHFIPWLDSETKYALLRLTLEYSCIEIDKDNYDESKGHKIWLPLVCVDFSHSSSKCKQDNYKNQTHKKTRLCFEPEGNQKDLGIIMNVSHLE